MAPSPAAEQGAQLLISLLSRVWYAPGAAASAAAPPAPPPAAHPTAQQAAPPPQQQQEQGPLFVPELEAALAKREAFDPMVQFARLSTSLELRCNEEAYAPFIAGCADVYATLGFAELCERYVERMGQEVEQLQMAALAAVMGVTVGVLDAAGSEVGVVRHPAGDGEPLFFLIHLPGGFGGHLGLRVGWSLLGAGGGAGASRMKGGGQYCC